MGALGPVVTTFMASSILSVFRDLNLGGQSPVLSDFERRNPMLGRLDHGIHADFATEILGLTFIPGNRHLVTSSMGTVIEETYGVSQNDSTDYD